MIALRPRSDRLAVAVSTEAVAVGTLVLLVLGLTLATWGTWGDLGRDTGYDLVAGSRVAHGHLPYVDFTYFYGPLAPFALGLAGVIGGSGLGPAVGLGLVLTFAIVAATYALARTQVGPIGSSLAATVTAAVAFSPTNLSYVLPHTFSATLAVLATLGFLLGVARYASGGRERSLLVGGFCIGLIGLTRPEFEAAVLFAGALWLISRARGGVRVRREAALLAGPGLLLPGAVYGAFLTAVSPHTLFLENLYPVDTLRAGGSAIIRSQAPLSAHSIAVVIGYAVAYAAGAAVLVGLALAAERLPRRTAIGAAGAIVLVGAAGMAVRSEAARTGLEYVYGWLPVGAAVALLLLARRRRLGARDQALLAIVAVLFVLAAKTYSGFFFLAPRAQPAVYAAPFALVALARLHLVELARRHALLLAGTLWIAALAALAVGLTLKDARAQSATVSGPGGSLRVTPDEAPVYQGAMAAIVARTRPGDPILLAPQLTALYTLSGRTDPLDQISALPGALPKAKDELRAIAEMQSAGVRLAITDRHRFTEYDKTTFGKSFDRILAAWIQRNFTHKATLRPHGDVDHTLDVWVRRTP
jgi:hypothetical protein